MNELNDSTKRISLGAIFLSIGFLLNLIAENLDALMPETCASDTAPGWCFIVKLALSEFGLKGIAYTLIVMGSVLIVLYDYVASILGKILVFAMEYTANIKLALFQAIEKNQLTGVELGEIFLKTFESLKGGNDPLSRSLGDFLLGKIINQHKKDGGFWRRDYSSQINITEIQDDVIESDKFFKWREVTEFKLHHAAGGGRYNYNSGISLPVKKEKVNDVLAKLKYQISIETEKMFDIQREIAKIDIDSIVNGNKLEEEGLVVEYAGGDLTLHIEFSVDLMKEESSFTVLEESFISRDDNVFGMHFHEPTRGAKLTFDAPPSFEIYHAAVSGDRFGSTKAEGVGCEVHGSHVLIDSRLWHMPGIVATLVWRVGG